jgi:hypothetical protein
VVFIPAGLALLATEFQWARKLLHRVRPIIDAAIERAKRAKESAAARRKAKQSVSQPPHHVETPHAADVGR